MSSRLHADHTPLKALFFSQLHYVPHKRQFLLLQYMSTLTLNHCGYCTTKTAVQYYTENASPSKPSRNRMQNTNVQHILCGSSDTDFLAGCSTIAHWLRKARSFVCTINSRAGRQTHENSLPGVSIACFSTYSTSQWYWTRLFMH